ncbi:MAG: FtsX-like permease family protein [Candidatus Aminicenantes bacterium]|nr:FtsX-like permease family protein [Candidatus Aminicenantes bacterium]
MFDLEQAIKKWRKTLRKNEALEDGYITELESHLRDEIDRQIDFGKNKEEAFEAAVRCLGQIDNIGAEFFKTNTRQLSRRPPWEHSRWIPSLFWNYFKIAFRKIKRQKGYSLINIAGLAIGMVCCILILLWIQDELSFDRHHEKAKRIYRVGTQFGPTVDSREAFTAPPMAEALIDEFPEVLQAVRLDLWDEDINLLVSHDEKHFMEKGIIWADSSIFDVFTIPFIIGNPKTALTQPGTVVIAEDTAQKHFGDEIPLGKTIKIESDEYQITGVVENCPSNSHFQFNMIASLISEELSRDPEWDGHCYFTYLVLPDRYPPSQLEEKFPDFIKRHYGPEFKEEMGISIEEYYDGENRYYGYWLQPLLDIHLNPDVGRAKGDITYVYVFSSIALFTLLIACVNFMNLSTARSANRSKEVGLRKVAGSSKSQLVRQFLCESILLSLIALVIAIGIVELVLPAFRNLTSKQLELNLFSNWYILIGLFGLALFVGITAGSYPAFFLSSFQPAVVLKGKLRAGTKSGWLRSGLVIFQFSISVIILLGTFAIYNQLKYVKNVQLGFDKEQIVVIHRASALGQQKETFKQELLRHSRIISISNTSSLPGRHFDPNDHRLEGEPKKAYVLHTMSGDHDFVELLNLEMVAGRYFSKEIATDATAVVINEAAVKKLGLSDPIGKRFYKEFGGAKKGEFVTIIGVVKDFHFHSLHHEIYPMVIRPLTGPQGNYTSVKIHPDNIKGTLSTIEKTWKKLSGGQPFEYSFIDDDFNSLYKKEQKTGEIFAMFSILAILIACLGLFGLASFTAEQRTKEIGIRKVLGASASGIIFLLCKEFTKWVLLANIIAWPIAYYAMKKWLQNFAYRINMGADVFIIPTLLALVIALVTISYQSIKASVANPADSLRYE